MEKEEGEAEKNESRGLCNRDGCCAEHGDAFTSSLKQRQQMFAQLSYMAGCVLLLRQAGGVQLLVVAERYWCWKWWQGAAAGGIGCDPACT